MSESARLFFAIVLGTSATAALLAGLAPLLAAKAARERVAAGVWMLALLGWLGGATWLAHARMLREWHGAAALAAMVLATQAPSPLRRALVASSPAFALGLAVLRFAGLARLSAAGAGWLPGAYANLASALDGAVALSAVALLVKATPKAVRWWSLAALATLAMNVASQRATVRPLPSFEALYDAVLAPLLAAAALLAARDPKPAERAD